MLIDTKELLAFADTEREGKTVPFAPDVMIAKGLEAHVDRLRPGPSPGDPLEPHGIHLRLERSAHVADEDLAAVSGEVRLQPEPIVEPEP